MEKFTLCSRILYDCDLMEKAKQIHALKKRLKVCEVPIGCHIYTSSDALQQSYASCSLRLFHLIEEEMSNPEVAEEFEREGNNCQVFDSIYVFVKEELMYITNNIEWSEKNAKLCYNNIVQAIGAIYTGPTWEITIGLMNEEERSNFIYDMTRRFLTIIIQQIPQIRCSKCDKLTTCSFDTVSNDSETHCPECADIDLMMDDSL